jgi:hypothetical protein
MIVTAPILATLVLFAAWDSSESETDIRSIAVRTDDRR